MERIKSYLGWAIFVLAILALLSISSVSAGSSLEVFLETFGKNVTVVEKNATLPGFLPGELGYQISGEAASSVLYLQSVSDDSNNTKSGNDTSPELAVPFIIESLKVTSTPAGDCQPFLTRHGASVTFPLSLLPGSGNSIALTAGYNCSTVGLSNVTFTMVVSNFAKSLKNLRFEISKETASTRLGFDMGTFLTVPDVAFNGAVLSDWAPASHTIQVSAGVLSSPFNIWMSKPGERQVIRSISLAASPSHCSPYIEGTSTSGVTIGNMPTLAVCFFGFSSPS